jgi:hypothetical protein
MTLATSPPDMPDEVWNKLLGLVASKAEEGFAATLTRAWKSRKYWRARVTLNGVTVNYYYHPIRKWWVKS